MIRKTSVWYKHMSDLGLLVEFIYEILVEAKQEDVIVKKMGLPQKVANWAISIDKKRAIVIANWVLIKMEEMVQGSVADLKSSEPAKASAAQGASIEASEQVNVSARPLFKLGKQLGQQGKPFSYKAFSTVEEALAAAEEQAHGRDDVEIPLEEGESILMQFPDGYYWLDLGTRRCEIEADEMGHCGTASGDTLFSLRDPEGHPHVTVDYGYDGTLSQIKGKGNRPPVEKYHEYVVQLLLNDEIKIKHLETTNQDHYEAQDGEIAGDLMLSQLTLDQQQRVYDKRPELFTAWDKLDMYRNNSPLISEDDLANVFRYDRSSAVVSGGRVPKVVFSVNDIKDFNQIIPDGLQYYFDLVTGEDIYEDFSYSEHTIADVYTHEITTENEIRIAAAAKAESGDDTVTFDDVIADPEEYPDTVGAIVNAWASASESAISEAYANVAWDALKGFFSNFGWTKREVEDGVEETVLVAALPLSTLYSMFLTYPSGYWALNTSSQSIDIEELLVDLMDNYDSHGDGDFIVGGSEAAMGRIDSSYVYADVDAQYFNQELEVNLQELA